LSGLARLKMNHAVAPTSGDIEKKALEVAHDDGGKSGPLSWDSEAEKKLRWKCDRHVLPSITLLFFMAFLDRTNIGEDSLGDCFLCSSSYPEADSSATYFGRYLCTY
jgi:hypothetical protein